MLVVHCDSPKLKADGLHLGSEVTIMQVAAKLLSEWKAKVEVIDGGDRGSLLARLAGLAGRKFDVVLLIGHSNEAGLKLASDPDEVGFVSWGVVPEYLRMFEPRRLVLAACQAGRWTAAQSLFAGVPSLQQIFACPVNASKNLATALISLALFGLDSKVPPQLVTVFHGIGAMLGGQVRYWAREDMADPRGQILDHVADIIQPVVKVISTEIADLVRNK